jgi:hypothetical protein
LRGEGWGEGLTFEFGQKLKKNSVKILNDIVVPNADDAVTEGAQLTVTLSVFRGLRMLAAVKLDNQPPFSTNEVHMVAGNRVLPDEFEAAQLTTA